MKMAKKGLKSLDFKQNEGLRPYTNCQNRSISVILGQDLWSKAKSSIKLRNLKILCHEGLILQKLLKSIGQTSKMRNLNLELSVGTTCFQKWQRTTKNTK